MLSYLSLTLSTT